MEKRPKQISHIALANCAILTKGENYFLTHVTTGVHTAVGSSFTLSLVISVDFMAGKSAAAVLA